MGRPPKLSSNANVNTTEGGSGEGSLNRNPGPMMSWTSCNRQHPWNLKRRTSTHFVLPIPAIEESTYGMVAQQIQERKRRQFHSGKRNEKRQVELAEQQIALAESKVTHARQKLEHVKKLHEQAKADLKRAHEQEEKDHVAKANHQIQLLEQQIQSIKSRQQELKLEEEKQTIEEEQREKRRDMEEPEEPQVVKKIKLSSDVDGKTNVSLSKEAIKKEEENSISPMEKIDVSYNESLEKVKSDIDELNQTKSQLIWLFKQVITAEKNRKEEAKRKEVAAAANQVPI